MEWIDPKERIWGFHCHQELPFEQFPDALVIQQQCARYLAENGIDCTSAAFLPGYGPHLLNMWELRVETASTGVLQKLGLAASFLTVNRFGLSGHIHPLMHDAGMDDDLKIEGVFNQPNALWFGYKVEQNQNFFFEPPRDNQGRVEDTRSPRILSQSQIVEIAARATPSLAFRDPANVIKDGFTVSVDFGDSGKEKTLALEVCDAFLSYIAADGLRVSETNVFTSGQRCGLPNGGWEVQLDGSNENTISEVGVSISWLMCNRNGLNVSLCPRIRSTGSPETDDANSRSQYGSFVGNSLN